FEGNQGELAPVGVLVKRVFAALGIAFGPSGFALTLGIAGYHWLGGFGWIDSLLEASMILGGMGPVNQLASDGVKVFGSLSALFSGLVFIAVMGVVLSPIVHRFLHTFHLDAEKSDE